MDEIEIDAREIDTARRQSEALVAANRESIAAGQSTIEHQRTRCLELEDEIARCRRQLAAMSHRTGNLDDQLRQTNSEVDDADQEYLRLSQRVSDIVAEADTLASSLEQHRQKEEHLRAQHVELAQQQTHWSSALETSPPGEEAPS